MTSSDIRAAHQGGDSALEILRRLVDDGFEFPDAEWKVTKALGMKPNEVAEMRDGYDNNI